MINLVKDVLTKNKRREMRRNSLAALLEAVKHDMAHSMLEELYRDHVQADALHVVGSDSIWRRESDFITPKEVYLGGIYGLNTESLDEWLRVSDDEKMGVYAGPYKPGTALREVIADQYGEWLQRHINSALASL